MTMMMRPTAIDSEPDDDSVFTNNFRAHVSIPGGSLSEARVVGVHIMFVHFVAPFLFYDCKHWTTELM